MSVPAELHYTPEHEWVSVEGTSASVGITEYAAQQLGDVVYISLPTLGATVTAGEPCGEVESVKSVSDLYSPVDGEVTEVNTELEDDPSLVNAEPYTAGWIFRVRVAQGGDGEAALPPDLLSAAEYEELTKSAGGGYSHGNQAVEFRDVTRQNVNRWEALDAEVELAAIRRLAGRLKRAGGRSSPWRAAFVRSGRSRCAWCRAGHRVRRRSSWSNEPASG